MEPYVSFIYFNVLDVMTDFAEPWLSRRRFIPVLSRECVSLLEDTQPYIIGINSYILDAVPAPPPGGLIGHTDPLFGMISL